MLAGSLILLGCGGSLDSPPDTTSTGLSCYPLQPCTDAAGEADLADGCALQHPNTSTVRGCALDLPTPSPCENLATPAPLACADGSSLRVVCCP